MWHDLQLQVPDEWALGYAPFTERRRRPGVRRRSARFRRPEVPTRATPYVGRPGAGSDACDGTGDIDVPEQDFVWFGSPLDRGEDEESGRTVTTVRSTTSG